MGGFSRVVSLAKDKGIVKPVEPVQKEIKKEIKQEKKPSSMINSKRKGRQYSIATSAQGDLTKVETKKKTLLG